MQKKLFIANVLTLLLLSTTYIFSQEYDSKSLIIKVKDTPNISSSLQKNANILNLSNAKESQMLQRKKSGILSQRSESTYVVKYDSPQDIDSLIKQIESNPNVVWAEPNYIYKPTLTPNDPKLSEQYHIDLLGLEDAWAITQGSSDVIIAVIDTGILTTHEDLKDKLWENTAEVNGTDGVDDDGNGKIDDKNGWDFGDDDSNVTDTHGHGTHVSGIAAADTNNSLGVAGTGFNVKIMTLKANPGGQGTFSNSDIVLAINYAVSKNADVINMSLGGPGVSQAFSDAIDVAVEAGITVVVAAGNDRENVDTTPFFPASHADVITVAAAKSDGNVDTSYSNFGPSIDLLAPGTSVLATIIGGTNTYGALTGTSMASPVVAGIVGLLKSYAPNATRQEILTALTSTATDKGTAGRDDDTGHGLINPKAALEYFAIPQVSIPQISNDFVSLDQTLTFTFTSLFNIDSATIQATIDGTPYSTSHAALTFNTGSPSTLTIDLSQLSLGNSESIPITLQFSDTQSNSNTHNITLKQAPTFTLKSPDGTSDKLIVGPNPFNPAERAVKIGFQISQSATISTKIYSLQLEEVFEEEKDIQAGYNEISWTGKNSSNKPHPNGTYIAIVKITPDNGELIVKRLKIALLN